MDRLQARSALPLKASAGRHGRTVRLGRWSTLSTSSKRLLAGASALLVVMVGVVGLTVWQAHGTALSDANQNVSKLGIAIAEQTARSIQAVDIMLQGIKTEIINAHIDTREQFRAELGRINVHEELQQHTATLPQADAFTIVGADGKLVNFSRQWPVPVTDVSDRDYYQHFKNSNDPEPFISRPVQNRGNGEWTLYIVRRVNGPTGEFLGLVLGAVQLAYFRDFYQALTAGAETTVTLLRTDGTALTSFPTTARIGEKLPETSPWHAIVARRRPDSFTTQGVLAPGLRLVSVHPLREYPLVVNVSLSEWRSLAAWRSGAAAAAAGTGSAALCVGALLWALMKQLDRLESTKRLLEDKTKKLELSEADLEEKSAALGTTLEHMNQGIIMVDRNECVAVCNSRAVEMLGLSSDVMKTRPSVRSLTRYQPSILGALSGGSPGQPLVTERTLPNGRILELHTVKLAAGGVVETLTDITDRRVSEERIRYFAHHDDLTKLVNRVVFQERLQQAIALADRSARRIAVLYMDLDGFKQVNDTMGHAVGDELLVEVAVRLRSALREMDTVARMGGDEFAIIQPLIEQPDAAASLAKRLIDLIEQPFDVEGGQCRVGVSIGVAYYPDHAATARELLVNADKALYRAKAAGRRTFRIFGEDVQAGLVAGPAAGVPGRCRPSR